MYLVLPIYPGQSSTQQMAVLQLYKDGNIYQRPVSSRLLEVEEDFLRETSLKTETIYMLKVPEPLYKRRCGGNSMLYWHDLKKTGYDLAENHPGNGYELRDDAFLKFDLHDPAAAFWSFVRPGSTTVILVCVVEQQDIVWRFLTASKPKYGLFDLFMDQGGKTAISIDYLRRVGHECLVVDGGLTCKIVIEESPEPQREMIGLARLTCTS